MAVYGAWADVQVPSDLTVGHAADGLHKDGCVEIWSFLPVGCGESLGAEAAFTSFTGEPLDTGWGLESPVVANFYVGPWVAGVVVVYTVRAWAVGRDP